MTTTKDRLKALTFLKILKTLIKFETYFDLRKYIKQYIHFYAFILRFLQNLKISLLKKEFINDDREKTYTFKMELTLTFEEKNSFKLLQKAINKVIISIHFNFNRTL